MDLNPDFFDMIAALEEEDADFLVVGPDRRRFRRGRRRSPPGRSGGRAVPASG